MSCGEIAEWKKLFPKEAYFLSRRRRHTRWNCDWSSDVCSSDLGGGSVDLCGARHGNGAGSDGHPSRDHSDLNRRHFRTLLLVSLPFLVVLLLYRGQRLAAVQGPLRLFDRAVLFVTMPLLGTGQ